MTEHADRPALAFSTGIDVFTSTLWIRSDEGRSGMQFWWGSLELAAEHDYARPPAPRRSRHKREERSWPSAST